MTLKKLLKFVEFTHKFQQVRRVLLVNGEERQENDAEHSYQLALVAWYLVDSKKMKLDLEKVIRYAIVHDLVEVYAGDTYFFTTDQDLKNSKKTRETEAAKKIAEEFSEISGINQIIFDYEEKIDEESKFVYALDKILPVMNIFLDGGRSWRKEKVDLEMLRTKDEKVKSSPVIEGIWWDLVSELEKNKNNLFGEK
ncbi:MAG: HD domain-containing protein [Patescibacteria group bacterium]